MTLRLRSIASFATACACALMLATPTAAENGAGGALSSWVPWDNLEAAASEAWARAGNRAKAVSRAETRAGGKIARPAVDGLRAVSVIEVPIAARAAETTGFVKDAILSIRSAVENDPRVSAVLRAKGIDAKEVLGAVKNPGGSVTVFVGDD